MWKMSSNKDTKELIITKAFDKWADKRWFQICIVILFFYLLLAPIVGPIIYNNINRINTEAAVAQSFDNHDVKTREAHQVNFEKSKQCYAIAKNTMKDYVDDIDCDYMLLIEYHNGTENIMNGIQFCRFDITLEVNRPEVNFISLDKFRDDIVARYDLLLSEELANARGVLKFNEDEFTKTDPYLAQHLKTIDAKQFAIVNIYNEDKQVCASLVCISKKENMNIAPIYQCERELEILFKNTYNTKDVD